MGKPEKPEETDAEADSRGKIAEWYARPEVAERYAGYQTSGTGQYRHRSRERRIIERLIASLPAESAVLDAPCGTGRYSTLLAGFRFSCMLDRSFEMIRRAASAAPGKPAPCTADLFRLPFRDGALDAVLCLRFLHHLPDSGSRRACLSEIARVTREAFICTYFEKRSAKHLLRMARAALRGRPTLRFACTKAEFESDLAAAGFVIERVLSPYPFLSENRIIVCGKAHP